MRTLLLATTALLALALASGRGDAAEVVRPAGSADLPGSFISIEAGYVADAGPYNADFKADDKLGNLDPLHPGQGGGSARFAFGQSLADEWDYRFSAAAVALAEDETRYASGDIGVDTWQRAAADQDTHLAILDAELGYQPADIGLMSPRLFAGLRGLHAVTGLDWSTVGNDGTGDYGYSGRFHDEVFALGPRIGAELTMPITGHDAALVASVSGSVLFGAYDSTDVPKAALSESGTRTLWNAEVMGGLSLGLGHGTDLTLGYRAAEFGGLMQDRSDINKLGNFSDDGQSDLTVKGPFARLTIDLP